MIASPIRRPLHLALAPTLLVGVLALSACGGGDDTTTTNAGASSGSGTTTERRSSDGRQNMDELRACLKKQGVELPDRPSGQDGDRPEGAPDGGTPPEGGAPPNGEAPTEGGLPGGGGAPPQGQDGQVRPGGPFADLSDEEREKLQKAMEECGGGRGGPGGAGRRGGADSQGRGQRPDVDSAAYRKSINAYVTCVRKNGYDLPDPDFSGDGPIFDPKEVDQTDARFKKASKACQSTLRRSNSSRNGGDGKQSGSSTTTTTSSGA